MTDSYDDDLDIQIDCTKCGASVDEGWVVPDRHIGDRFYCSVPCLASDGTLTPEQALNALHTDLELALPDEEIDVLPLICPRCGSTEQGKFLWAAGCQWPTGTWDEWHMPNHVGWTRRELGV